MQCAASWCTNDVEDPSSGTMCNACRAKALGISPTKLKKKLKHKRTADAPAQASKSQAHDPTCDTRATVPQVKYPISAVAEPAAELKQAVAGKFQDASEALDLVNAIGWDIARALAGKIKRA